jgi:hypothetical protein
MSEHQFRLVALGFVFATVFAVRAAAGVELQTKTEIKKPRLTEMQQALSLADEIQALNQGVFNVGREPFHPESGVQLDTETLSLSQHSE